MILLGDSIGTVHNQLQSSAATAAEINQTQDLSDIEVGLHDEIYQANRPVLVGVDAASTYCYLLQEGAGCLLAASQTQDLECLRGAVESFSQTAFRKVLQRDGSRR